MTDLSIVVVNYNTRELTINCLKSIFASSLSINFDVWLVDNNSSDDSVSFIRRCCPKVKIVQSKKNLGFSQGNNLALRKIYKNSKYCLLLNSDTVVPKDALNQLYKKARDSDFAVVGCKLIDKNGKFQPNAGSLPFFLPMFVWISGLDDIFGKFLPIMSYQERRQKYYQKDTEFGWVSGCVILVKKSVFEKIGFLDDKIFMYGEDVDFCWRAKKAGFRIGWIRDIKITHLGGGSIKEPHFYQWRGEFRGLLYLYKKYYGGLASACLKGLIYFFVFIRIIAFFVIGKASYAKNYAKVLTSI